MQIIPYSSEFHREWDAFVQNSRNGTFMQERTFLNYHTPGKFTDCSLIVRDSRDNLMAVIPAALQREGDKTLFSSYPGASHGGIIIGPKFGTSDALDLVSLLIEHCRARGFQGIIIKQIPRIYYHWPCDELDFAMRFNGFFPDSTELATTLPLQKKGEMKNYQRNSTWRNTRKAVKQGVTVKVSNDYADYWDILVTNLKERHRTRPTHTLPELLDLVQKYPRQIKLLAAFYHGEMIAGVLAFLLNSRVINCFYIAHKAEYQHLRPLNLLFHELINRGTENGFKYLDWGISTENKGKYINRGLFRFKEGFGGRGVLRETYRLNLD